MGSLAAIGHRAAGSLFESIVAPLYHRLGQHGGRRSLVARVVRTAVRQSGVGSLGTAA